MKERPESDGSGVLATGPWATTEAGDVQRDRVGAGPGGSKESVGPGGSKESAGPGGSKESAGPGGSKESAGPGGETATGVGKTTGVMAWGRPKTDWPWAAGTQGLAWLGAPAVEAGRPIAVTTCNGRRSRGEAGSP